jgi:toxin ParE1/3/4
VTPVVWTFSALADLEGIRRYIGNFNPSAARDMAERIIETGNSLTTFPYRGRQVPDTRLREITLGRPYIIRYRVDPDRVVIPARSPQRAPADTALKETADRAPLRWQIRFSCSASPNFIKF